MQVPVVSEAGTCAFVNNYDSFHLYLWLFF